MSATKLSIEIISAKKRRLLTIEEAINTVIKRYCQDLDSENNDPSTALVKNKDREREGIGMNADPVTNTVTPDSSTSLRNRRLPRNPNENLASNRSANIEYACKDQNNTVHDKNSDQQGNLVPTSTSTTKITIDKPETCSSPRKRQLRLDLPPPKRPPGRLRQQPTILNKTLVPPVCSTSNIPNKTATLKGDKLEERNNNNVESVPKKLSVDSDKISGIKNVQSRKTKNTKSQSAVVTTSSTTTSKTDKLEKRNNNNVESVPKKLSVDSDKISGIKNVQSRKTKNTKSQSAVVTTSSTNTSKTDKLEKSNNNNDIIVPEKLSVDSGKILAIENIQSSNTTKPKPTVISDATSSNIVSRATNLKADKPEESNDDETSSLTHTRNCIPKIFRKLCYFYFTESCSRKSFCERQHVIGNEVKLKILQLGGPDLYDAHTYAKERPEIFKQTIIHFLMMFEKYGDVTNLIKSIGDILVSNLYNKTPFIAQIFIHLRELGINLKDGVHKIIKSYGTENNINLSDILLDIICLEYKRTLCDNWCLVQTLMRNRNEHFDHGLLDEVIKLSYEKNNVTLAKLIFNDIIEPMNISEKTVSINSLKDLANMFKKHNYKMEEKVMQKIIAKCETIQNTRLSETTINSNPPGPQAIHIPLITKSVCLSENNVNNSGHQGFNSNGNLRPTYEYDTTLAHSEKIVPMKSGQSLGQIDAGPRRIDPRKISMARRISACSASQAINSDGCIRDQEGFSSNIQRRPSNDNALTLSVESGSCDPTTKCNINNSGQAISKNVAGPRRIDPRKISMARRISACSASQAINSDGCNRDQEGFSSNIQRRPSNDNALTLSVESGSCDPTTKSNINNSGQAISKNVAGPRRIDPRKISMERRISACSSSQAINSDGCNRGQQGFSTNIQRQPGYDNASTLSVENKNDAGPSRINAGPSRIDAGPNRIDAGPSRIDAGPSRINAGPSRIDAGPSRINAGPSRIDAGPNRIDAGPSRINAGPSRIDAGPSRIDAGPSRINAGLNRIDPRLITGARRLTRWSSIDTLNNYNPRGNSVNTMESIDPTEPVYSDYGYPITIHPRQNINAPSSIAYSETMNGTDFNPDFRNFYLRINSNNLANHIIEESTNVAGPSRTDPRLTNNTHSASCSAPTINGADCNPGQQDQNNSYPVETTDGQSARRRSFSISASEHLRIALNYDRKVSKLQNKVTINMLTDLGAKNVELPDHIPREPDHREDETIPLSEIKKLKLAVENTQTIEFMSVLWNYKEKSVNLQRQFIVNALLIFIDKTPKDVFIFVNAVLDTFLTLQATHLSHIGVRNMITMLSINLIGMFENQKMYTEASEILIKFRDNLDYLQEATWLEEYHRYKYSDGGKYLYFCKIFIKARQIHEAWTILMMRRYKLIYPIHMWKVTHKESFDHRFRNCVLEDLIRVALFDNTSFANTIIHFILREKNMIIEFDIGNYFNQLLLQMLDGGKYTENLIALLPRILEGWYKYLNKQVIRGLLICLVTKISTTDSWLLYDKCCMKNCYPYIKGTEKTLILTTDMLETEVKITLHVYFYKKVKHNGVLEDLTLMINMPNTIENQPKLLSSDNTVISSMKAKICEILAADFLNNTWQTPPTPDPTIVIKAKDLEVCYNNYLRKYNENHLQI